MIVDSSALLAIMFREAEHAVFTRAILATPVARMSVVSYVEVALRVERLDDAVLSPKLDELLSELGILLEPVTVMQAHAARAAYRLFGKGRHPAGLNFGDCFTYALAKVRNEPLLFKGDDFGRTDISIVP